MPKFLDRPKWYGMGINPTTPELLEGLALPPSAASGAMGQIPFITNNTAQYGTLSRTPVGNSGEYLKTGGPNSSPYWSAMPALYRHYIVANGTGSFTYIDQDNNKQTFSGAYASPIIVGFVSTNSAQTTKTTFATSLLGRYSINECFLIHVIMDSMNSSGNLALKAQFEIGYLETVGIMGGVYNLRLYGISWFKDNPEKLFTSFGSISVSSPTQFEDYADTVSSFYKP